MSETLEALRVSREAGYATMISHRSGATDDTFIADLAVGSGCGQIKSGAPARGERVVKYNQLLEIADSDRKLPFGLTGTYTFSPLWSQARRHRLRGNPAER
jgi:enolase